MGCKVKVFKVEILEMFLVTMKIYIYVVQNAKCQKKLIIALQYLIPFKNVSYPFQLSIANISGVFDLNNRCQYCQRLSGPTASNCNL